MSEQWPISVHILTWNSGKTLRRTLESVRNCAEILVIDGGSSDDTLRIAKEYGAKVIPQRDREQGAPLQNFAGARNRGLQHATQPWILSVDSDEYASPALMENILQTIQEGVPCACFLPRHYVLPDGREVTHATTYPNERIYFFHKDAIAVEGWEKRVHERPKLKPGMPIKHFRGYTLAPIGTPREYREKNRRYLALEQLKSSYNGWSHWLAHRVIHTLLSRGIAFLRLLWIWCLPHKNCIRLPLRHEFLRFWYGWKLIVTTCPLSIKRERVTSNA
ncbi:glycosyltransferase family 2 protein [Candidatus Peregrinibacteria bacterium]|nr:glycosyltransferase family 2 protein [Candidatus Peregrinibacteria bacterium]MBI4129243.1 glycosyltransferase family 2 protein [Candidatus Peregrinibacteria bacterium]